MKKGTNKGTTKKGRNSGMIREDLLQRIDKLNDDVDFDPYKSVKKMSNTSEELFKDEDYLTEEDKLGIEQMNVSGVNRETVITTVVIVIAIVIVIGVAYVLSKLL